MGALQEEEFAKLMLYANMEAGDGKHPWIKSDVFKKAVVLSWQTFCRFSKDPLNKRWRWLSASSGNAAKSSISSEPSARWLRIGVAEEGLGSSRHLWELIKMNMNGLLIVTELLYQCKTRSYLHIFFHQKKSAER